MLTAPFDRIQITVHSGGLIYQVSINGRHEIGSVDIRVITVVRTVEYAGAAFVGEGRLPAPEVSAARSGKGDESWSMVALKLEAGDFFERHPLHIHKQKVVRTEVATRDGTKAPLPEFAKFLGECEGVSPFNLGEQLFHLKKRLESTKDPRECAL